MGIYLPNMEMPTNCFDCPCVESEFMECSAKEHLSLPRDEYGAALGEVPNWCPLVPVPPHGDLIDRDKLREKEFVNDGDAYAVVMSRDVRNAPTIIPAEPSEEQREYEAQVEAAQYCEMYEPSYDPETGAL